MTISINLKPSIKTINIEGYGEFKVRPLGASEELELARLARESKEISEQLDNMDEYVEAEKAGDTKKYEEGMAKIAEVNLKIQEFKATQISSLRSRVSSKDPKAVDKLFAEIPFKELNEAIVKALSEGENV